MMWDVRGGELTAPHVEQVLVPLVLAPHLGQEVEWKEGVEGVESMVSLFLDCWMGVGDWGCSWCL